MYVTYFPLTFDAVLSIASPVLRDTFRAATGETPEVELPGRKFKDVCQFLECIYPDFYSNITCEYVCEYHIKLSSFISFMQIIQMYTVDKIFSDNT